MANDQEQEAPGPTPVTVACGCNLTIADKAISPETRYSTLGMMTLLFGITARPKRIDYVCLKCGKTVDRSVDAAVIRKYTT